MKKYEHIFISLKEELCNRIQYYLDEDSGAGIFIMPIKDNMGDNFVIRLREKNSHYIIDDGGAIGNTLFIMSETIGGTRASKLVSDLTHNFDCHPNRAEGVIELIAPEEKIVSTLLHFTKLLVTLDTMLVEVGKEEREAERPQRQSLGPRASQRVRKRLKPLIKAEKVRQRVIIAGLTVPDWMVDFAYEPKIEPVAHTIELALLITVDLAVLDPIAKATHAFSRAVDIRSAHANYDIHIGYDRHGQNSNSAHAADFISQHQIDTRSYHAIDLSNSSEYEELFNRISSETGMPISL